MEPTISALLDGCINVTDPANPRVFRAKVYFDVEFPLELRFKFDLDNENGPAPWLVARQLVIDGLGAVMLTGLGDFRCRSTSDRMVVRLISPEGDVTISLPRAPIQFVLDEAEVCVPLDDACILPSDEDLAAWLAV